MVLFAKIIKLNNFDLLFLPFVFFPLLGLNDLKYQAESAFQNQQRKTINNNLVKITDRLD